MGDCLPIEAALGVLLTSVRTREFFELSRESTLQHLQAAYFVELEYLKTAYATKSFGLPQTETPSPSEVLFKSKYDEVDRTLTGILALRWIYDNDYQAFTHNQNPVAKLSEESFKELRNFFCARTNNFSDVEAVFTLIMLMMTNDLGKSTAFQESLSSRLPEDIEVSQNHDVVMYQALKYSDDLVPSFKALNSNQQRTVRKLIQLSADFNPGQLVQGECPPSAVDTLLELDLSVEEVDMKFMELFLDVGGSRGHVNHEGAATMTEAVFKSYQKAHRYSIEVATGRMSAQEAYDGILEERLAMLGLEWDLSQSRTAYAKARLFCMGRVINHIRADLFDRAYDSLPSSVREALEEGLNIYGSVEAPAIQATYMPAMIERALTCSKPTEALAALFTYLSRVLCASKADMDSVPGSDGAIIFERDVRPLLEPLMAQDEFMLNPKRVLNEHTALPPLTVAKRAVSA